MKWSDIVRHKWPFVHLILSKQMPVPKTGCDLIMRQMMSFVNFLES